MNIWVCGRKWEQQTRMTVRATHPMSQLVGRPQPQRVGGEGADVPEGPAPTGQPCVRMHEHGSCSVLDNGCILRYTKGRRNRVRDQGSPPQFLPQLDGGRASEARFDVCVGVLCRRACCGGRSNWVAPYCAVEQDRRWNCIHTSAPQCNSARKRRTGSTSAYKRST